MAPGDDNVRTPQYQKGLEIYLLSRSLYFSLLKQKMFVRSVAVLLSFKTRHVITEGCTSRMMTLAVLGLDSIMMKHKKLRWRLHLFKSN
jgi:hypothetical protein